MYNLRFNKRPLAPTKAVIEHWPVKSRKLAIALVKQYGAAHEVTDHMLVWYYNSPWKRTTLYREGVPHNFPFSHTDLLCQTVEYHVPLEKHQDLAVFDGSLVIDRTRGELSAHCESERMNVLMLNIAHELATNQLSVEEARAKYAQAASNMKFHWPEPYADQLQFGTSAERDNDPTDPDHATPVVNPLFSQLVGRRHRS